MHRFIYLAGDIQLIDTAAERLEARRLMAEEPAIAEAPIFEGGPDTDATPTGETFTLTDDGPDPADLPSDEELAATLAAIVDPETSEDDRSAMIESFTAFGRVSVSSFRSAGLLTNNEGFVLEIGSRKFQVTVVS